MSDPTDAVIEPSLTFSFVDMAGFTALTEAHGDLDAARTVDVFVELVQRALAPSDRLVKTIGDAVMLTSEDPSSGIRMLARIADATGDQPHFPQTRAGIHHGPAVEHDGDYIGSSVNLAARITALAGGDQTLATEHVAESARDLGIEVTALGPTTLHNIAVPVEVFDLDLAPGHAGTVVDPVCLARIDRSRAVGSLTYDGTAYRFCSLDCAARFARHPARFAAGSTPGN